MTRNQDLNVLHVNNASAFADSVTARVVPGDSLIFDFIYFLHPVRCAPAPHAPSVPGQLASVSHMARQYSHDDPST